MLMLAFVGSQTFEKSSGFLGTCSENACRVSQVLCCFCRYELCMVLPHYSSKGRTSDLAFWFHLALAAFMYVNGLANLYKMRMAKLSGDHDVLLRARRESLDETTWIFCVKCQDHIPPRSHHCPLCDECILRRDHHCWFAGCCVGIANHRSVHFPSYLGT